MKIPVLFIIFNRPETEKQVFEIIRQYKPEKLYVAADGPRPSKDGERERCREARAIIDSIDWPCEVKKLYQDSNLGCGIGVSTAISWFFENEEYGAIIEDDVKPSLEFFTLCEEALPKYQQQEDVMMVTSYTPGSKLKSSSLVGFSKIANIWAWASWRRAWSLYDFTLEKVSKKSVWDFISWYGLVTGIYCKHLCNDLLKSHQATGKWHTWDTQWGLSLFLHKGYSLAPYVNLTKNIGVGFEGAHYSDDEEDPCKGLIIGSLKWPIIYPKKVSQNFILKIMSLKDFIHMRKIGFKKRLKNICFL